jgi:hypothetical protein
MICDKNTDASIDQEQKSSFLFERNPDENIE